MVSGPGGPEHRVADLSAALVRQGHEVTLYGCAEPPEPRNGYTFARMPEHPGSFARCLHEHWGAERPDVAHAHFWTAGIVAQLAADAHRIPTVATFSSLGAVQYRAQARPDASAKSRLTVEKLIARHATWVTAHCTDDVLALIRMGRSRARLSVVPCGVDLEVFTTEGPAAARGAQHRVLVAGKILPHNAFDTAIEALPVLVDTELVIVGQPATPDLDEDPQVRRLRGLADRLGVGDRVHFTGAVSRAEMPALLRSADVVGCASLDGSFSVVALEAMACGIPVVAAAVGGTRDTVVHDVTGRLVTSRHPREYAAALSAVLRNSFYRRSLGLAGRDRACARYSWDRVAADNVAVYDRVIGAAVSAQCPRVS